MAKRRGQASDSATDLNKLEKEKSKLARQIEFVINSLGSIGGLDERILALFARIQQTEPVRDWCQKMLRLWINDQQQESR